MNRERLVLLLIKVLLAFGIMLLIPKLSLDAVILGALAILAYVEGRKCT